MKIGSKEPSLRASDSLIGSFSTRCFFSHFSSKRNLFRRLIPPHLCSILIRKAVEKRPQAASRHIGVPGRHGLSKLVFRISKDRAPFVIVNAQGIAATGGLAP